MTSEAKIYIILSKEWKINRYGPRIFHRNILLREFVGTHVILTSGACWGGPEPEQMAHFRQFRTVPGMSSKSMKNIRNNNVLDTHGCPQSTFLLKKHDNYNVFWLFQWFYVFAIGPMKYQQNEEIHVFRWLLSYV